MPRSEAAILFGILCSTLACSNGSAHLACVNSVTGGTANPARFACTLSDGELFGDPIGIETGIGPTYALHTWGTRPLAVGDLNGDGILDIAEGDFVSGDLGILLGNGDGSFQPVVNVDAGMKPWGLLATGLGSGSQPALVISGESLTATHGIAIAKVGNMGHFGVIANPQGPQSFPTATQVADLNNDCFPDLFTVSADGAEVFLANPSGGFAPAFSIHNNPAYGAALGDFNDDGVSDLITYAWEGSEFAPNVAVVQLGKGDGTFSDAGISTASPMSTVAAQIGDLNEDGHLDLLVRGYPGPPPSISVYTSYVLFGHGDGTFSPGPILNIDGNTAPGSIQDLDGDGHLDIVGTDDPGVAVHVALGNGDGTFRPEVLYPVPGAEDGGIFRITVGDVNGDGRPDIIANNFLDGKVTIFLNQCR